MIEIRDIYKSFNNGETYALNGINVLIPQGEFVVMVGSNGSGKSTLLNIVAGNIYPDKGKILVDNNDVTPFADHNRSRWISRVFQNPLSGTAPELSVLENFRLAALRTHKKGLSTGTTEKFKALVASKIFSLNLGLENKLLQPMGSLSGGQRQALTLLMAVMDETKLLLMDEPVSALDPRTAELVMKIASNLIKEYQLTAILVTHSLRDAHLYGDRIVQLAEGKVVKDLRGEEKKALSPENIFAWF